MTSHQTVRLSRGKHASPESGVCVMELASMLAGEPFTDRPESVSRVIGAYLRSYNDAIDDERRQDLYRCAADVVGTAGPPEVERDRADHCRRLVAELHAEQSPVRRWLSPRPRMSGGLEDAGVQLARVLRRRGEEGHQTALAVVEQLAALGRRPATPARRPAAAPLPVEA